MPLIISPSLPAIKILQGEGIDVEILPKGSIFGQEVLRIAVLNLMPLKIDTETDLVRVISTSPLNIELCWMKLNSYKSHHISEEHMAEFYRTFDDMRTEQFDGLIITGAPVEQMDFEEVSYWKELTDIFNWSRQNVRSTLYICWAAQAGMYYHYGIKKYPLSRKMFGIFLQRPLCPTMPLFRGFDDTFLMPHSRHTEVRRDDIASLSDLKILAESPISGVSIVASQGRRELFVTGHMEYAPRTLHNEYMRDCGKRDDVDIPINYYPNDNPANQPRATWRAHATLMYNNWINYYVRP